MSVIIVSSKYSGRMSSTYINLGELAIDIVTVKKSSSIASLRNLVGTRKLCS